MKVGWMTYNVAMTTVREIKEAIEQLPLQEYLELSRWMEDHDLEGTAATATARIASMLDEEDGGGGQLLHE